MRCPVCGAPLVETEEGRLVCLNGHVVEEWEPVYQPPRGDEEKMSRIHTAPLLDYFHRDAGLTVTGDRKLDILTIKASMKGVDTSRVEARRMAYRALAVLLGDKQRVDTLMATAAEAIDTIYSRGRRHKPSRVAFAAAVYALNHHGYLVDNDVIKKLEAMFMVKWRSVHKLLLEYGLSLKRPYRETVMQYISRYASKLGLQGEVETLAYRIASAYINASNKRPLAKTLAAAALYLAAKILRPVSYTKLTSITGLTEIGIRNVVRDIMRHVAIEVRL